MLFPQVLEMQFVFMFGCRFCPALSCFASLASVSLSMDWLVPSCLHCWSSRLHDSSAGLRLLLRMRVLTIFGMRRLLRNGCGLDLLLRSRLLDFGDRL